MPIMKPVTPNCRMKCSGCGAASFGGGIRLLTIRVRFSKTGTNEIYRSFGYG